MEIRAIRVMVGDRWYTVEVDDLSTSPVRVTVEGETFYVEVEGLPGATATPQRVTPAETPRPATPQARDPAATVSDNLIRSPMPGRVIAVNVRPGDTVVSGQELCVVEAMKMEQSISTSRGGVVKAVHVRPLQQVSADDLLVELD